MKAAERKLLIEAIIDLHADEGWEDAMVKLHKLAGIPYYDWRQDQGKVVNILELLGKNFEK